jgi:hypothetical protein
MASAFLGAALASVGAGAADDAVQGRFRSIELAVAWHSSAQSFSMAISDAVADAPPCFVSQAAVSRHMRCEATQSSMQSVIDIAIPSIRCCCAAAGTASVPAAARPAPAISNSRLSIIMHLPSAIP